MSRGSRLAWRRPRDVGFTLFELIIVIILVALFSGVLLHRFLMYQEMAEKAAMERTASHLRSALHLQMAGLVAKGRQDEIAALIELNPFRLLDDEQANYLGEYFEPPPELPRGSWYYDLKTREAVYLVRQSSYLAGPASEERVLRFKAALVYNDFLPPRDGRAGRDTRAEVGGLAFKVVTPYSWQIRAPEAGEMRRGEG